MIQRFLSRCRELGDEAESGQVMVEFALVFPVQLFLTLCVIQFAFMAHATIVVNQAAFMGARAGAVAVVNRDISIPDAGRREAARHVALLTTGGGGVTGGQVPADGGLEWNSAGGSTTRFSQNRQNEAYALLQTTTQRVDGSGGSGGYVFCDVTFDYIMVIPVANHFFAAVTPGGGADTGGGQRRTTYRVRRVGFVPIPWTQRPVN